MKCKVTNLRIGQRVDLENDPIADPEAYYAFQNGKDGNAVRSHPEWECEYETVAYIEQETPGCIRVDFYSGFSCGFPTDHEVDIDPEQED